MTNWMKTCLDAAYGIGDNPHALSNAMIAAAGGDADAKAAVAKYHRIKKHHRACAKGAALRAAFYGA